MLIKRSQVTVSRVTNTQNLAINYIQLTHKKNTKYCSHKTPEH